MLEAQASQCEQVHGKTGGEAQEWVRSMLATCGRGGNAQAVRDEILNIMHRNNIGEKRGTWMEVSLSDSKPLLLSTALRIGNQLGTGLQHH